MVKYGSSVGDFMKDFPFFTTRSGVAGLTLKEIPYSGNAYITIHESNDPHKLVQECLDFCLALDAKAVYASGHSCLEAYPFHTYVISMGCLREQLGDTEAELVPLRQETMFDFCQIYNRSMKDVPNASYMSQREAKKLLKKGTGYFVYSADRLLGIGIAGGERIDAIVSIVAGHGKNVLLALNKALTGQRAEVEVASANARAVKLYEKLGFTKQAEFSKWYKIF